MRLQSTVQVRGLERRVAWPEPVRGAPVQPAATAPQQAIVDRLVDEGMGE
jgi:hypothetical protein